MPTFARALPVVLSLLGAVTLVVGVFVDIGLLRAVALLALAVGMIVLALTLPTARTRSGPPGRRTPR